MIADPGDAGRVYAGGDARSDVFVTSFDNNPRHMAFSSYLGGADDDVARSAAVGQDRSRCVVGETLSADFRQRMILQPQPDDSSNGFLACVDRHARLVTSTYVGGSSDDDVKQIAADDWGQLYLAGVTNSADFRERNRLPEDLRGDGPGPWSAAHFMMKLTRYGRDRVYSSFVDMNITALAADSSGRVWVAGIGPHVRRGPSVPWATDSGATLLRILAGAGDADFATNFGGYGSVPYALRIGGGRLYVTGRTYDPAFPVMTGPPPAGGYDAFVMAISVDDLDTAPTPACWPFVPPGPGR